MEALNDFSKGMQSDVSKLIQAKNTYLEAINFRPFTELGSSNTSLVTIKGNSCGVKFPTMRDVYKLKINLKRPTIFSDHISINITGTWGTDTITNFVINTSTTIDTLYALILALPNYGIKYTAAYKDNYIMIYQRITTVDCIDDVDDFEVIITENISSGIQNTLWYILKDGDFATTPPTPLTNKKFIAAPVYPLIPIGYTTILEDIYLFVSVDNPTYTDIYPTGIGIPINDDYTEPGYIFKLQYDETSNITTLTLVYAGLLNFTKYASIAPSAAIGRYESDQIQRIYWSDFYNKVRTLNITDPQIMGLNSVLTGVVPSVNFDIPIITNIIGGSLNVGTYELCYRLKQTLGAITNYSVLSNMVHLASGDINDFAAYEGSVPGSNSNKGIRYKISNIDTAFDTIEYVVTFRDAKTDVCKIYSVDEVGIPSNGELVVDITSLATADEILLTDFLTIQSSFTHAKTVDTKDNRLFWGNTKYKTGNLPEWDSRAFRAIGNTAPTWNDIILTNAGITSTNNLTYWTNIINNPETNDCINEYYDNTGAFSANACYFKPGTAILGGAGANISYEFGTYATVLDDRLGQYNGDSGCYNIYGTAPFRKVVNRNNYITQIDSPNDSPNQVYVQGALDCLKSPYRSSILRGFQHEEIYRFGIQFSDLEGGTYFTKWIADIKMPSYGDPNPNPDPEAAAAGVFDFRLSFDHVTVANSTQIWGQTLYIKFTVDISGLEDIIGGYRIVRMERTTDANKTILGCGMISPMFSTSSFGSSEDSLYLVSNFVKNSTSFPNPLGAVLGFPWYTYPSQAAWETMSIPSGASNPTMNRCKTFDCFDFFVNGGKSYSTGDRIFIRSRLVSRNYIDSLSSKDFGYRWWDYSNGNGGDWFNLLGANATKYSAPASNLGPGIDAYYAGSNPKYQSGLDTYEMAYYMHMYIDDTSFSGFLPFSSVSVSSNYNKTLQDASWTDGGNSTSTICGGTCTFHNYGTTYAGFLGNSTGNPCWGHPTYAIGLTAPNSYNETDGTYLCTDGNAGKLLALYYRPNSNQYGGNTYSARAGNEYIACGSFIPIKRNNITLTNNIAISFDVTGGDVYLNYWDIQKASKHVDDGTGNGPVFRYYAYNAGLDPDSPGTILGNTNTAEATVSVTHMFPCTNIANQEMRFGDHINTSLNTNIYYVGDSFNYATYHSNESNIIKYHSKPLDFIETNKWINRVHYSEIKHNNETKDNWQVYKTNNFYDVEGNYGSINALVAFKENLYYIQERGFGILYVNPMTAVTSDNNIPVVLGLGATIQRHNYIKLDVGTIHQWSVFRSPDNISFIDSRHKTQYLFNGSTLEPISDLKGQRNFFIKRFHPEIILRDNPIINKGVHTTYDFYHKEFITTFNNSSNIGDQEFYNEKYTLVYSEPISAYSSFYTCTPKIYFNNNRYIFSFDDDVSLYVHNVGYYGTFYETETPASVKILVNDHPLYTKVFDNLMISSESVDDQVEWIDEIITPDSNTQAYSDNINKPNDTFNSIRCYTEAYNSDWTTLTLNTNIKKKEQSWFTPVPRNKVDYDLLVPGTSTIFDPTVLTKVNFGERMRDKYMVIDLKYDNTNNYRFVVHNLRTYYRVSSR